MASAWGDPKKPKPKVGEFMYRDQYERARQKSNDLLQSLRAWKKASQESE